MLLVGIRRDKQGERLPMIIRSNNSKKEEEKDITRTTPCEKGITKEITNSKLGIGEQASLALLDGY
jgi:hypothetical protein